MSDFRHVAPAPALASSTPDPSCTTDLVFRFQVGAGRDQGLGDFQAVVSRCLMKRGLAVLSWKEQVGAHGREGTKEGISYEQLSPCRPGSCTRFEHAGSIMYYSPRFSPRHSPPQR